MTQKSQSNPSFVVREPRDLGELEDLLRLRYSVFRDHELRFMVRENAYKLDVDAWDKQAWHLGLYKQTASESQAVGYVRLIHNGLERADLLFALGQKYPELASIITQFPPAVHPFLDRYMQILPLEALSRFQSIESGALAEVSRFSLLSSEKNRSLGHFMVQSVTAICHYYKGIDTVFEVAAHHATYYQRFGYHAIAKRDYEELPWETFLIHAHSDYMNPQHHPLIQRMAKAYEETQGIWLHPAEPENFYPLNYKPESNKRLFALAEYER